VAEDPTIERLDDARDRWRRIVDNGQADPAEALRELATVRDDLLFIERQRQEEERKIHARISKIEAAKVDKNPTTVWVYRLVVGGAITAIFSVIAWLVIAGLDKTP
jgi:hypothetical protein